MTQDDFNAHIAGLLRQLADAFERGEARAQHWDEQNNLIEGWSIAGPGLVDSGGRTLTLCYQWIKSRAKVEAES